MDSNNGILDYFYTQGPWAVLFVLLLGWVLKQNQKNQDKIMEQSQDRENRLIELLDRLSRNYEILAKDVSAIKDELKERK